jgi:hypothetical protein
LAKEFVRTWTTNSKNPTEGETEMAKQNSRFEQARREANDKVDSLGNLSDEQREHVRAIALGHIENHSGEQIHYENVANYVRSLRVRTAAEILAAD